MTSLPPLMTSSSQQIITSPGQKLETPIGLLDNQIIADTDNSRTKRQKLSDLGGMNNSQVGVRVAARGVRVAARGPSTWS